MKYVFLSVFLIGLCSCINSKIKNLENEAPTAINLIGGADYKSNIMVSILFAELKVVPLETSENSLIRRISKIILSNERLFIQNGFDNILCFERSGKFILNFDKRGRGEGEYLAIKDFAVSPDTRTLLVLSDSRLMIYKDAGNGYQFTRALNLRQPYLSKISIVPGTDNILISTDPVTGTEKHLTVLINENGDTIFVKPNLNKFEKSVKVNRHMLNESLHFEMAGELYFKEEFCDTVFSLNKQGLLMPRLVFDSDGKGLTPEIRYGSENSQTKPEDYFWVYTIIGSDRYLVFSYENNMERSRVVFDKVLKTKYMIPLKDAFIDDLNGGPAFDPIFCSGNKFLSFIEITDLKKFVESDEFKSLGINDLKKKEKIRLLSDSLEITDNPLVVIATPLGLTAKSYTE